MANKTTGTRARVYPADWNRELRARRAAKRQRATLHKSSRRDPRAWDYGRYWIELHDGTEIGLADGWAGLTLAQVEKWLDNELDGAAA
jgi:hypothetical protein